MRIFTLSALAVIPFIATMTINPIAADAAVVCKTVGVPKGCVVARAPVARAVARPGVPGNRGGPVNRVGRR